MSNAIAPVPTHAAVQPTHDPQVEKLRHAAKEFESILVKQLLKASKIGGSGGEEKANGYADMAVDALTTAVEHGGGLGLARRIEAAIGHGGIPGPSGGHNGSGG
jgi:Rod binding domain-containing protein